MKTFKEMWAIFGLTVLVLCSYTNVYASVFNDIDETHKSYLSAKKMLDLGLMVGDLQGNFKPDSYISKFDTIKIISKIVQDKDIDTKNSKYNNIVLQYDNQYERWDSSANVYMVYLLEKGILKEEELKDFVIIDKNNKEQIRALSNEEIALFLTRILNKQDEIEKLTFDKIFNDEKNISPIYLKSCYFMDSLNIIQSKDNNFYPKSPVTRISLATILDKFLSYADIQIIQENQQNQDYENMQARFVTIEKVFLKNNSIQTKIGNETKIYSLLDDTKIYIDGDLSSLENVQPNTNAEIIIQDNFVVQINADTSLKIENVKTDDTTKISGVIKNVSTDSIGLSYKQIDENGFYSKQKIDIIQLDKNCKITKNGATVKEISLNSLATVVLKDKVCIQIIIEDENALFIGSIVQKSKDKITIKTSDDKVFDLGFAPDAKIIKNGQNASIQNLKIGDKITLKTKQDKILNIDVIGKTSTIEGVVKSIKINETNSVIEIEENDNNTNTYYVDNLTTDIYSIKILDKVKLCLDSLKVYAINILERKYNKNFTGEIIEKSDDYITVFTQDLTGKSTVKVLIDKDTIFFDYNTLQNSQFSNLKKGDKVYIVLKDAKNGIASNINIVSK